jgi:hypothetical protein
MRELKVSRRFYPDRTARRVAVCMFAIVVILALYAVVQRLG